MPCFLKVGSALQNLKRLELYLVSINDIFLKVLVKKIPLLEHLEIDRLERINIVSDSLKHLNISLCKNLVEAEIDAPSLLKIDYFGEDVLSLSLKNTCEELMTSIYLRNFGNGGLSDAWFRQLRELLKSVNRGKVSFTSGHLGIAIDTSLNLRVNPLPVTENDMPGMNPSSPLFTVFVNTLFSSSRPTSICSGSLAPVFADFMKFLSSELLTAMENSNCYSSDQTKCWRHYVKDIKVEVLECSQKVWRPLRQEETLQFKFSILNNIRLRLKWYATLNAQV